MSFYENLKEIYKDTTQIVHGKDLAGKIVYLLKSLSVVAVCLIYIIEECGLRALISYNIVFKIPQPICVFLSKYIIGIIGAYVVFFLIFNTIIKYVVIEVKTRLKRDMFPAWYTLQDISRTVFYSIILLKMSHDMLLCIQGTDVIYGGNLIVYIYIVLNVLIRFVGKVYLQNANDWYYHTIRYTEFFDLNGKRIAENDKVVYRNQIHNIYNDKGILWLEDYLGKRVTKLEDAVMDVDGQIKVYFYNMGKKREEDKI